MSIIDLDLPDHANEFLRRKNATQDWSESTLGIRSRDLRYFLDWIEEQDLEYTEMNTMEIEDYLIYLKNEGYAPNTIAMRYTTLQMFYRYLAEEAAIIAENPMQDLEKTEMMRGTKKNTEADLVYVTPEEKEQLVEHAPTPRLRSRLIIRLLWQTGVRQGEAAKIKLEDIDRESRSIKIYATKTDDTRQVFYQESLDFLLEQWLDHGYRESYETAQQSPYLIPSQRAPRFSDGKIGKFVVEAAKQAGIQEAVYDDAGGRPVYRIGAHALRHGHAVHALKSGIDIRWVQEHLGHADISTTEKYLRVIDQDVKEAYEQFQVS